MHVAGRGTLESKSQIAGLACQDTNVIVLEADQYGKQITPMRYFHIIIEILHDALSFLFIMPTYSEEDLMNALAMYRNREFTLIRKCAYAFNILYSILAS
jgi:hypothetical protein